MPYVILQPELEMVARGLEKLLKFEQREILMNMLTGVCSEESHRSAAEALGLLHVCLSSLPEIVIVFPPNVWFQRSLSYIICREVSENSPCDCDLNPFLLCYILGTLPWRQWWSTWRKYKQILNTWQFSEFFIISLYTCATPPPPPPGLLIFAISSFKSVN